MKFILRQIFLKPTTNFKFGSEFWSDNEQNLKIKYNTKEVFEEIEIDKNKIEQLTDIILIK